MFSINKPLKLAIVGGALNSAVGYTHYIASRLDGYFKVEAGCFSRDPIQNKNSAETYGISFSRLYSDWKTLLLNEQKLVDALVILTPTPNHLEILLRALELGYPVICEKALATNSNECQEIINFQKRNNGYLAVFFNYSGYPMLRQLKEMISHNTFGKLQQLHIEMPQESFLRKNSNPQEWRKKDYVVPTVSLDLGVHVHHLISFLTNDARLQEVVGEYANYGIIENIVDNVYCIGRFDNNLRFQGWWGKTALGKSNGLQIRIYGEKGSAEWYQMDPELLYFADNIGNKSIITRGSDFASIAKQQRYNRFKAGHPAGFIEAFANLYCDIAQDLSNYFKGEGLRSSYVFGGQQALEGIKFLEAINESVERKQWVSMR